MAGRSEFEEMSPYLNQLSHSRVLTREEEVKLSRQARKGSVRAREQLVLHNLPFVVAVAKKHMGRGVRLDDLIQEGNVGLLKAIEHFDPEKGNRFATYAVWWIRAYVTRYLKDNRSHVRGGEKERAGMRICRSTPPLARMRTATQATSTGWWARPRVRRANFWPPSMITRSASPSQQPRSALESWAGTSWKTGSARTIPRPSKSLASAGAFRVSGFVRLS